MEIKILYIFTLSYAIITLINLDFDGFFGLNIYENCISSCKINHRVDHTIEKDLEVNDLDIDL